MKLPLREPEHVALLAELTEWAGYVSSALLGVEAIRACSHYGEEYATVARSLLHDIALMPLDDTILDEATGFEPTTLRSLDALHLATALSIRDDLGVFVTYDQRLAAAAEASGLSVLQPA